MSVESSYNFRRIDERLTTSGLVSPEDLAGLRSESYDAVINLLPDDSEYAIANEADIVRDQGLDYVSIPVDFDAPTAADFDAFVKAMDDHDGQQVHVHCAANYRVSAFYGLYAVQKGRWTAAEADALVHGIWDPAEFPAWAAFLAEIQ